MLCLSGFELYPRWVLLIFPLHCDLAELSLSFARYFPFRSDLLKEFYHSEVI